MSEYFNAYFIELFGETVGPIVGLVALLVLIAILLWVALILIRRFRGGLFISGGNKGRQPRLAVTDAVPVDSQRRLVLVRRDDVEHLILIGGPTDIVIEAGIGQQQPPVPAQTTQTQPAQRPAIVAAKEAVADVERGRPVRVPDAQLPSQSLPKFAERRDETMVSTPNLSAPNVSSTYAPPPVTPPAAPPIVRAVEAPAPVHPSVAPPAAPAVAAPAVQARTNPELDLDKLLNELRPNPLQDR